MIIQHRYAVIEAPSILGLKPTGVDRLPQTLLENRLAERIDARHAGRVEPLLHGSRLRDRIRSPLLTDLEQRGPLVRPADVVAFGFRDADEQRHYGSQPLAADILALDLTAVRRMGIERAAQAALERLTRPEIEGVFIHLDADCLDDRIMPAVDYRLPGAGRELTNVLAAALGTSVPTARRSID